MKAIDIYNAWAPADGPWSPWVKPVLFAERHRADVVRESRWEPFPGLPAWFDEEVMRALDEPKNAGPHAYRSEHRLRDVALVVDLPSDEGVKFGLAITTHGFRPVPLYNAAPGPPLQAIVNVWPIMEALERGVARIAEVPASAPPAFLLDFERGGERAFVRTGLFDNRSICRSSDFPSVERFKSSGIRRIVLLCEALRDDLRSIALEWQSGGLELWLKRPSHREPAAPTRLRRPWLGKRLLVEWRHAFLTARADGLYGRVVEESSGG